MTSWLGVVVFLLVSAVSLRDAGCWYFAARAARLRTSLSLTAAGRTAFQAHVAELRRITGG